MGKSVSDLASSSCSISQLTGTETSVAATKAKEILGDAAFNAFDHWELWIPAGGGCSWGGLGMMPGKYTWERADYGCDNAKVRMHEIGHNYGLHHAGTISGATLNTAVEYGDQSGPMGAAGAVGYVLPHVLALTWVQMNELCAWTEDKLHTVQSLRTKPTTTTCSGIVLHSKDSSDDTGLFFSFRTATGIDSNLASKFHDKVTVHFGETAGYNHKTNLHATLDVGEYYVAPSQFKGVAIPWNEGTCGAGCTHVAKFCKVQGSSPKTAAVAVAVAVFVVL